MNSKQENLGKEPDVSWLDNIAKKDSYKVPPGYFDTFPQQMQEKAEHLFGDSPGASVSSTPARFRTWISQRPWTVVSAAAAVALLITLTIAYQGTQKEPQPIITQTTHTQPGETEETAKDPAQPEKTHRDDSTPVETIKDPQSRQYARQSEHPALTGKDAQQITTPYGQPVDTLKDKQPSQMPSPPKETREKKKSPEEQSITPDLKTPFIAQQPTTPESHSATTSPTSQTGESQKAGLASHQGKTIPEIFPVKDTCIQTPQTFRLPPMPNGYNAQWSRQGRNNTMRISASGSYNAIITNEEGDTVATQTLNVTFLPEPQLTMQRHYSTCRGKNLKLDPGFYDENYHFEWSDGVNSPVNFVSSPDAKEKQYSLKITGCETYTFVTTVDFKSCDLKIPNVITPDGSGVNEQFVIEGLENYPGSRLIIMDRNGNQVYSSDNYQNDFDGQNLPKGAYFYVLTINDNYQTTRKGILHIYF